MPRLALSLLIVASILGLTACSKKQEPTPIPAETTPAASAEAVTPAPDDGVASSEIPAPREFDFSGKSTNTGPTSPATPVKPGEPQGSPADTITVQMPVMIEYYPPFYPIEERMRGAEGRLQVAMIVTETGEVETPTIISSTMPAFNADALKAAASWRFLPALHEGKPIRVPLSIPVSYVSEYGSAGMPEGSPLADLVLSGDTYYSVDADGKFTPANRDAVPLTRPEPVFLVPEGVNELRATLRFRVDEHGRVNNPEIVESSGTDFDKAAIKAVRFWQFLPKLKNGKAVAVSAQLPFRITRK